MLDESSNPKSSPIEENPASITRDTSSVDLEKLKDQTTQVTVNGSTDNEEPWFEEMNGRDKGKCVSDILVDSEVVAENTNEDMIYGDVFEGIREIKSDSDSHHSDTSESDNGDTETTSTKQTLCVFFSCFTSIVKEASAMTDIGEDEIITRWMNHKGKPYRTKTHKPPVRPETERKLRELMSEMAEEIGITTKKRLPWRRLLNILADSGYFIDNYPDISTPGSTSTAVDFGKYKPLRYISLEERKKLINAILSKNHPCTFKPYRSRTVKDIRALKGSEAPIIMFMPSHTSSSNGKLGKRMFLDGSVDFDGYRPCKKRCGCVGD